MNPWVDRLGWALIHFLWQGALIALLYVAARRSRTPQTRYLVGCLALAAMTLAPIVTFAISGQPELAQTHTFASPVPTDPAHIEALQILPASLQQAAHPEIMPWLVMAWFAGAIVFWARLTGSWIVATRMRSTFVRRAPPQWQRKLDEIKTRIRVSQPVRLLTSALVQTPAVIGWLRPVILMPIGALAGLPAEQIEALLAHELAHIRRHDYLVNILQSIAESLLFYHPAVWWISNQIRNERELCCDDVAVAISGDTLTYVRALADLEQQRPAHLSPALAASGGSLRERIARLLGQPAQTARPGSIVIGALIVTAACGLFAQPTPDRKSFEGVSIKPNNLSGGEMHEHNTRGLLNAQMTTRHLIQQAFDIKDFQILDGPTWLGNDNFDFVARTASPVELNDRTIQPYLQSVLADRFQFHYHRETRDLPVYFLLAAKTGPKLTKHTGDAGTGMDASGGKDKISMSGTKISMAHLCDFLGRNVERPVIDRTGIEGEFDLTLEWSPAQLGDLSGPSIYTALQEQLGLRLESGKGPVDMIVIDSIEKPSEN